MKSKYSLRAIGLIVFLVLLIPAASAGAGAMASAPAIDPPPPADMFQLPWEAGQAWVAIDGIDNGTNRPLNSSHYYLSGGAIDFAPHNNMIVGEDTSHAWVVAAAAGNVIQTSSCHLKIDHGSAWVTEYQFVGNLQVKAGDHVERGQRLAVVADGLRLKFCPPAVDPDVPHLHFMLRPNLRNASFSGWAFGYNPLFNATTFTKGDQSFSLFKPILNGSAPVATATNTSVPAATNTPGPDTTEISPTNTPPATFTPGSGPSVSTALNPASILVNASTAATVNVTNPPAEGYTSAEFTCTYNPALGEVSNIAVAGLFGSDAVVAVNGPQNGKFIVAVAGSNGAKATASGAAFTFSVKGLQVGQVAISCAARASKGDGVLSDVASTPANLAVVAPSTLTPTATTGTGPTPTPTPSTPLPGQSPTRTPTATPTAIITPTPTPLPADKGLLTGKALASKPVGIILLTTGNNPVASVAAASDGSFSLLASAGSYNVVAGAAGFLPSARLAVTITNGSTTTLPTVSLAAGDIDNNNVIDQFDALSVGMNYNAAVPAAADLNGDGTINVLDLELLARNYHKTGPQPWQ